MAVKESAMVVYGNVVDGLNFIGPFESMATACQWAEEKKLDEWNACLLEHPQNFESSAGGE